MTNNSFFLKFNFRLICLHLLASIFIILGAQRFSFLYDLDIVKSYHNYGSPEYIDHLTGIRGITSGERIVYFLMATIFASLIALIISFSISLTISLKRKIFWLNSFIVLIIGFLINRLGILDFTLLKTVTNGVGDLFISCGLQYDIIINGGLFTTVGLLIYFNKWTNTFILKQYDRTTTTNIT